MYKLVEKMVQLGPVFIHINKRVDDAVFQHNMVSLGPSVVFLPHRFDTQWGSSQWSHAIVQSMKWILHESRCDFDYLYHCSGQDYPICSLTEIQAKLADGVRQWIDANEVSKRKKNHLRYRSILGSKFSLRLRLLRRLQRLRPAFKYEEYLNGMVLRTGAPWWCLSNSAIQHICNYMDENESVWHAFKDSFASEEFLFPTLMYNSPYQGDIQHTPTGTPWHHAPDLNICEADIPLFTDDGRYLMARKFDAHTRPSLYDEADVYVDCSSKD